MRLSIFPSFIDRYGETVLGLKNPILLICIALLATASGCQRIGAHKISTSALFDRSLRDFQRAEAKHELAIERMCDGDYCEAEQLLRDSLICDSSFGPAHNTLGKLYFDQGKYYLAAWEFEYAQKFLPERPEPLNNLGLVFEAVGNYDKAIEYFNAAWSVEHDNAEFLGNLVRARIRNGDTSSELRGLLQQLISIDDRETWVDWAREQIILNRVDEPVYSSPVLESPTSYSDAFEAPERVPKTGGIESSRSGTISDLPRGNN